MTTPSPWVALILLGGAYRIWRLLAIDSLPLVQIPRYMILGLPRKWEEGDPVPATYRWGVAQFINCPWCFGFWIALATWGIWEIFPHSTTVLCFPLAVSAAVGIVREKLDPPE